jgi:Na+/H+ antiporter NhaD/arsenite permease-like protein
MIAFGTLSLEEAFKAVDLDAIALLLGMMIIVAQLRVSGFFELATRFATQRAHGPLVLLTAIVIVTGFFSSFLVNDAICLVMAPLVIDVTRALCRNPVPYLLAVAMASNAGSAATFTGNPQNMIIGVTSHLPYAEFFARLAPAAAVALVLTIGLIGLLNPGNFLPPLRPP